MSDDMGWASGASRSSTQHPAMLRESWSGLSEGASLTPAYPIADEGTRMRGLLAISKPAILILACCVDAMHQQSDDVVDAYALADRRSYYVGFPA